MIRFASVVSLAVLLAAPAAPGERRRTRPRAGRLLGAVDGDADAGLRDARRRRRRSACRRPPGSEPPKPGKDDKCKMTDVKRTGSRMTWKMKCEDGTTGDGDMTSSRRLVLRDDEHAHPGAGDAHEDEGPEGRRRLRRGRDEAQGRGGRRSRARRAGAGASRRAAQEEEHARRWTRSSKMHVDAMFVAASSPAGRRPPAPTTRGSVTGSRRARGSASSRTAPERDGRARPGREALQEGPRRDRGEALRRPARSSRRRRSSSGENARVRVRLLPGRREGHREERVRGRKFTSMPPAQREFCTKFAQRRIEAPAARPRTPARRAPARRSDMKSTRSLKGIFGR